MSQQKFLATVCRGRISLNNVAFFREFLQKLEGDVIELTIGKVKKSRTLDQNALYWRWLTILGDDLGYSKEEMHFCFKKMLLSDKLPPLSRDEFTEYLRQNEGYMETTRRLSTKEMAEYMDKISEQARELDIKLPLPER